MTKLRYIPAILVFLLLSAQAAMPQRLAGREIAGSNQLHLASADTFNKQADKPYRPDWAPLPLFRGKTSFVPILQKSLASAKPEDRARSAFLLGQIGARSSAGLLFARLRDSNKNVRIQSGIALACISDQRGVAECTTALKGSAEWIRYYAVYGLWRMNTPDSRAIIRRASAGGSDLVKSALAGAVRTPFAPFPTMRTEKTAHGLTLAKIWSDTANAFSQESDWWFHRGNYNQCIRCMEAAILFSPANVDAYSNIAYLQWSLGRDAQAVVTLRRCITANPHDSEAYYQLGQHLMITKHYAQAEQPLAKSVALNARPLARRTYAHCLEKLGKNEEAAGQWEIILRNNPQDGTARVNLNRLKKKLGR